jgi:hypothetical protein
MSPSAPNQNDDVTDPYSYIVSRQDSFGYHYFVGFGIGNGSGGFDVRSFMQGYSNTYDTETGSYYVPLPG